MYNRLKFAVYALLPVCVWASISVDALWHTQFVVRAIVALLAWSGLAARKCIYFIDLKAANEGAVRLIALCAALCVCIGACDMCSLAAGLGEWRALQASGLTQLWLLQSCFCLLVSCTLHFLVASLLLISTLDVREAVSLCTDVLYIDRALFRDDVLFARKVLVSLKVLPPVDNDMTGPPIPMFSTSGRVLSQSTPTPSITPVALPLLYPTSISSASSSTSTSSSTPSTSSLLMQKKQQQVSI